MYYLLLHRRVLILHRKKRQARPLHKTIVLRFKGYYCIISVKHLLFFSFGRFLWAIQENEIKNSKEFQWIAVLLDISPALVIFSLANIWQVLSA